MANGGTLGMNPEQVRQLGNQLTAAAGEIRNLVSVLSGQLENTHWVGPDRDTFQSDWQGTTSMQLNQLAQALTDMSQRAMQNVADQEQTSNSL
jgi:uncharacterized protein YukE